MEKVLKPRVDKADALTSSEVLIYELCASHVFNKDHVVRKQ